jgi:peptidoglycan/xylan/chitin deacetylase (PgdA/CDA1 family)
VFNNPTVVLYHDIAESPSPLVSELQYTTHPDIFWQHLRYFSRNFDVISITDLLAGYISKKSLLITFDDAAKSVPKSAGPILKSFNARAVFFLNSAVVTSDFVPIDNVISYAVAQIGLQRVANVFCVADGAVDSTKSLIAEVVSTLRRDEAREKKLALLSVLGTTESQLHQDQDAFLTPDDVKGLHHYRIDVGNHSFSHTFFRVLSKSELNSEIADSRAVLERLSGSPVRCLSIPYGNETDATEAALTVARASGHEAIFLVHARSNNFRPSNDIYYRVSLASEPVGRLPFKLGIYPVIRSIRNVLPL